MDFHGWTESKASTACFFQQLLASMLRENLRSSLIILRVRRGLASALAWRKASQIGMLAEQVADIYVIMAPKSSKWDACGPEPASQPYRIDRAVTEMRISWKG